ncbi:hypothetical protein G3O08_18220 [Cryomorpha ignava]|uniref:LPP20 family lipoprotein n=1 Tax=Cryomorpha ignava TaxID=101383 RepID=A0A7K3WUV0_9FLAO|nr:LPP20 family lipoprotein [Cryomorpha ignava]NEN25430.1 hypothetical protein [Cryomorpha ignava]
MNLQRHNISRFALLAFLSIAVLTGCKKNKDIKAPEGEVLISEYCSGEEFFSNGEFFRANGLGESMDQATAKKKALSNARADLASAINTTIKGTIDNYVNSREMNNKEEVEERFEGLTREVINQELKGTKTICQKAVKVTDSGNYKYYVALELSGQDLISAMNERLGSDEKLKIDYDYEKFKETFNEEMNKMKK